MIKTIIIKKERTNKNGISHEYNELIYFPYYSHVGIE